jgi:hypothetical protein
MGTAQDKLGPKTDKMIRLGADLAATYGGTTAEAVEALGSLLRGETDPIERYGIGIKEADIAARMAADGTDELTGAQGKAARSAALMTLLMKQAGPAIGASAREADTAASAQQRLSAKFDNLMAILGGYLLPLFTQVADFIETRIIPAVQGFIGGGGQLGGMFENISGIIQGTIIPAFQGIWNFITGYFIPGFMKIAGPVLGSARDAFEKITGAVQRNKDKFVPLANFMKNTVAPVVGTLLAGAFDLLGTALSTVIDMAGWLADKLSALIGLGKDAWSWASDLFSGGETTLNVVGRAGPAMAGAAAGLSAGLSGSIMGSSSGGGPVPAAAVRGDTYVNIQVDGALDPVAVGRQIDTLVRRYAQTTGRAPALSIGTAR